jgi:hypothetical protein
MASSCWHQRTARRGATTAARRENPGVAYQLKILYATAGTEPAGLLTAIGAAIADSESWERLSRSA